MLPNAKKVSGFTLIELMVTIAVIAILSVLAIPTFQDLRMRSIVRGSGDQMVAFWANARMEALKRNQDVTVTIIPSTGGLCMGADTSVAGCTCGTNVCNVGEFPGSGNDAQWKGAVASYQDTDFKARISAKRGSVAALPSGGINLSPPGTPPSPDYRLRFVVDISGRPFLCEPSGGVALPDYTNRSCGP